MFPSPGLWVEGLKVVHSNIKARESVAHGTLRVIPGTKVITDNFRIDHAPQRGLRRAVSRALVEASQSACDNACYLSSHSVPSVSDGINKDRENTKGTKEFNKSETEWEDVMDTLQHAISIIEKEIAKNLTFLQKEIDTVNTSKAMVALINSFQQTMMMKCTTEQITDVSCGNTAALVGIEQFL